MKTLIKNPIMIIGWPVMAMACLSLLFAAYMVFTKMILPALVWWLNYVPIFC